MAPPTCRSSAMMMCEGPPVRDRAAFHSKRLAFPFHLVPARDLYSQQKEGTMITPEYINAVELTLDLHSDHLRKAGNVWYVSHLFSVSALTMEMGAAVPVVCAALLHDAIEDRGGDKARQIILARMGPEVLGYVEEVTETDADPKPSWGYRKFWYIDHVATVSLGGLQIAIADKLHNARTQLRDLRLNPRMWDHFSAGPPQQAWWYRSLIDAFRARAEHLGHTTELGVYIDELEEICTDMFGLNFTGEAPD